MTTAQLDRHYRGVTPKHQTKTPAFREDEGRAYVITLSQAIAQELSDTNITSTARCPGAVATGFVKAGDSEEKGALPRGVGLLRF